MVSLLQPLVSKALAEAEDQYDRIVNVKRELRSLKRIVLLIEGALPEAEEKQVDNRRIRVWLRDLDDICYDARDILEEFDTSKQVKSNSLRYFLRGSHRFSTVIPSRFLLAKKIKNLRKSLDSMKKDMETAQLLDFIGSTGCSPNALKKNRPEVGPSPDKHLFVGREVEKEEIMMKLLNLMENHVEIVPIWGMGGIGKTTLVQSVYNDKRVTEELYPQKNRKWLFVGEKKFNAKEIIFKITKESNTNDGVEDYQKKLIDKFTGDRFLIVLDDVWDVGINEWKIFCNPLNKIRKGGLIIITTRTTEVITATKTPVPRNLRPLSYEDCRKIFQSHAFNNVHTCSDLEQKKGIGKQIVKKLKGLPLAAEVVGCSLSSEPDVQSWRSFLEADEWKRRTGDDDVMPALRWSYNRLAPHLRQCFTYCSLFPKDHWFYEKIMVEMWMAHGFIQSVEGGGEKRRPEETGAVYFKQLVNASMFQCVNGRYVMHDIIRDLAILVSNEKFVCTDDLQLDIGQLEKVRHLYFHPTCFLENVSLWKSKRSTLKRLLTLYAVDESNSDDIPNSTISDIRPLYKNVIQDIFKKLKSIRVLVLVSDKINYIPECISELIHLRYLDIRQTSVTRIPDTLCDLHNLQTFIAPTGFPVLPENIVNMTNLRHLSACLLTCKGVKNLTSLQELCSISVSKGDNISELGEMRQLRGRLRIKCLENVTSEEDAAQAMMQEKTIDHLELDFTEGLGDNDVQTKVLDALQCPPNLGRLEIDGYNGLTSPSWMVDGKHFTNLQRLHLSNCHRLELLPPLGQLKFLKFLKFYKMGGIKKLGEEFYGKQINQKVFFPSLKTLCLISMENLKEWDDIVIEDTSVMFFPCLNFLEISSCPNLVSALPHICNCDGLELDILVSLTNLIIENCSNLTRITSVANVMRSLSELHIVNCDGLVVLELGIFVSLTYLTIENCSNLTRITSVALNSLKLLTVIKCPMLETMCEDAPTSSSSISSSSSSALQLSKLQTDSRLVILKIFEHDLVSLGCMCIGWFPKVESLFNEIVKNNRHKLTLLVTLAIFGCEDLESLPPDIHKLSSLEILWLQRCSKLQALPVDGLPLSLEMLVISECPLLYERCQVESGADWHKIRHIPKREIVQTISLDRAYGWADSFPFYGLLDIIGMSEDSDSQ